MTWSEDVVPRIRWRLEMNWRQAEGAEAPTGYGIAWRCDHDRGVTVYMPLPINLIARALRELYYAMKYPMWGRSDAISFAYQKGLKQGPLSIPDDANDQE